MPAPEFAVPVSTLDAGGKSFDFVIRPTWLRGALEETDANATDSEGRLDVRLSSSGTDVVATGRIVTSIEVPCARCLGPARVEISHDFSVLFVPAASAGGSKKSTDDDEIVASDEADTAPFDGDTVVLDDFVRDEILLETPMIPLCSESCPGMSPSPGTDADKANASAEKTVDPRLLPLLRWKTQKKS